MESNDSRSQKVRPETQKKFLCNFSINRYIIVSTTKFQLNY